MSVSETQIVTAGGGSTSDDDEEEDENLKENKRRRLDANFLIDGMDEYQTAALLDIDHGENVFLTGSGGCGKTFLLKRLKDYLFAHPDRHCAITSTTGVTALLVGGRTVASFFGFGVREGTPEEMWESVRKKSYLRKRFKSLTLIVIDEISMLSAQTLSSIDYVLRKFRRRNDQPFGGIQMVLCGDFLQLEPVKGDFAFRSPVWDTLNLKYHLLKGSHRQAADIEFIECLREVRIGKVSTYVRNTLKERLNAELNLPRGMVAAELYSRRADADRANDVHLLSLKDAEEQVYHAKLNCKRLGNLQESAKQHVEANIVKNMVTPQKVTLRVGAQVMLTFNLDLAKGLANGSMGVVQSFDADGFPVILFSEGEERTIRPHTWQIDDLVDRYIYTYEQVPLILAWAITTHKAQGATLDYAAIKLDSSMFANGMAYVALSRVRGLKYFTLKTFEIGSIRVSNVALSFYEEKQLLY